jgi:hypothetical protein
MASKLMAHEGEQARPVRIQLARAAGFRVQDLSQKTNGLPAVVVARPSRWGNPADTTKHEALTETLGPGILPEDWRV